MFRSTYICRCAKLGAPHSVELAIGGHSVCRPDGPWLRRIGAGASSSISRASIARMKDASNVIAAELGRGWRATAKYNELHHQIEPMTARLQRAYHVAMGRGFQHTALVAALTAGVPAPPREG
jgi:hypothetical protein